MDYLEGLFLGPIWSDTDYECRNHLGLFTLYGFIVCIMVALSVFTGFFSEMLGAEGVAKWVMFICLFLATPFLCFRYYRYHILVKLIILLASALKYFMMTLILTSLVMPYLSLSTSEMQTGLINFLNNTLESFTEKFASSAGVLATVFGVLAGGIYIVFLFLFLIIVAIIIPGAVFFLVKRLQYIYDLFISRVVLDKYIDR